MKKIEAYIKKLRFNEAIERLHEIDGLTGISYFDIKGFGRVRDDSSGEAHVTDDPTTSDPHVKLEIICVDKLVNAVIETIQNAAHTGLRGDGKIYVSEINEAIRISNGDSGDKAC